MKKTTITLTLSLFSLFTFSSLYSQAADEKQKQSFAPSREKVNSIRQVLASSSPARSAACNIGNGNFEAWENDSLESFEGDTIRFTRPSDWLPLMSILEAMFYGTPINLESEEITPNNLAARLFIDDSLIGCDLFSLIECTSRPYSMNGSYQMTANEWNFATVEVYLTSYDAIEDSTYFIGDGFAMLEANNGMRPFSVHINYDEEQGMRTPDSVYVIITYKEGDAGTSLLLDNISMNMSSTGITNKAADKLKVYPNPANNELQIRFPNVNEITEAYITDIKGSIISHKLIQSNEDTWDISAFAPGIYILNVYNGSETLSRKIVKQ